MAKASDRSSKIIHPQKRLREKGAPGVGERYILQKKCSQKAGHTTNPASIVNHVGSLLTLCFIVMVLIMIFTVKPAMEVSSALKVMVSVKEVVL